MQTINKVQFELLLKKQKSPFSRFAKAIQKVAPGQGIVFAKSEWKLKTSPEVQFRNAFPDYRFSIRNLKRSYAVLRIK